MVCNDCGNKIHSWQEYCSRCGAELYKKKNQAATDKHSIYQRFFGNGRVK